MSSLDSDKFGRRMKGYESIETSRILMPYLPIYARLDGKCFHTFTKNLKRPYDERLVNIMINVTKYLVDETNALIGYTDSDEISLCWHYTDIASEPLFGGRIQKICSILSGMCSAKFVQECYKLNDQEFDVMMMKNLPSFDCRVINLPNQVECANMFLWRETDAYKNSISMAARSMFPHKKLQGKTGKEMQEMMFQEKGINFNDYPSWFKRGSFVRKITEEVELSELEKNKIPVQFRPAGKVMRSRIVSLDMPPFAKVTNRIDVIFNKELPITENNEVK